MNDDLKELLLALRENCCHKGDAAQALGISRRHLYTKLMKYGIPPKAKALKDFIAKHLG